MKTNILKFPLFILLSLLIISCSDDDDTTTTNPTDPYTISGNITADKTLTAGNVWTLKGRVSVVEGATLTIEAGTVIKATAGTGADASTLIIARGGKIDAQGTASKPIVMTSVSDNIQADGSYPSSGPALGVGTRGLWGGLLVLGKAPCSFKNDVSELQIEGIPVSDKNGLYGGSDAACSHTLKP